MICLYWYAGFGVLVLFFMMALHKLTKKKDEASLSDVLAGYLQPDRKSLWYRLLNDVLGPALVFTLMVPFWPVLVFFKVKMLVYGEPDRGSMDEPEFAVTRDDLQTQLSLQEVEKREIVFDPLGAVPNVPFGHLNAAWRNFCEDMKSHDHLWSFTAHWTNAWGNKEFRQGYVIERGEELGPNFLTVCKEVVEDADQEAVSGKKRRNSIFWFGLGIKAN